MGCNDLIYGPDQHRESGMREARILRLCTRPNENNKNLHAIAFILTEMHFRDWFFRFAEICSAVWSIYVMRREPTLTIGLAQVSFHFWRQRYGPNNVTVFRAAFDDLANYQICCDYLEVKQRSNVRDMIMYYNRRPSVLYVKLFNANLRKVEVLAEKCRSVKIARAEMARGPLPNL